MDQTELKSMRVCLLAVLAGLLLSSSAAMAQDKPEFPPLDEVVKGYEKVVSTADGQQSFYTIWKREKDGQMLAALPAGYEGRRFFIAMTVASGQEYAGLQAGDMYVYWKRYDKTLALVEPNIGIRSDGDQESKDSVNRLFTDRVLLDVPIVAMSGGSPVIDMDALLVGQASKFFGSQVRISNPRLVKIAKAKAFPKNVELAFEVPATNGQLQTIHYSISEIPENTGYQPRPADERVGYFTTSYSDYGQYKNKEIKVRYINRWHLEKADPSLQLSPPKNPIVFYIEHSTPVRYRRWVREGILFWNQAFEKVGINNAIEVHYQDKRSGAHMEKDPEDVRYNFVRWLNNNIGTAIGPSRVHPQTGQILDADIILTDGWIRHFWKQFHEVMPQLAMEGMSPETTAWLSHRPNWDPRVRLAPVGHRDHVAHELSALADVPYGGHALGQTETGLIGSAEYDGLAGRHCQINGMCRLAEGKALDVAMFRMQAVLTANLAADDEGKDEADGKKDDKADEKPKPKEPRKEESMIDGIPESFIGPMLAELVCHEVGHTLGLRHNFKGSAAYSLAEINSEEFKGKKPLAASVMDYLPVNMNCEDGDVQGDYTMIGVGPYDVWAIEYGYTLQRDLKPILSRVAEPELLYATDEDTSGPDPLARRYDFSSNPLDYAESQMRVAKQGRARLIDKLVKDGESWSYVRKGYEMTLGMQMRAVSMMANWLGGAYVYRDKKGDKDGRLPIEVVCADKQREALAFVVENAFKDEAYGLSEDLLRRMTVDKWFDDRSSVMSDATWPIHDTIMGMQASTLTMVMNPTTMRRIYDNEFLVPGEQDAMTLPELLDTLTQAVWTELDNVGNEKYTARKPMISSLRRNLQREYLERMIDLSGKSFWGVEAYKPISNLVCGQLRLLKDTRLTPVLAKPLDPYTRAHLEDAVIKIEKALQAQYVYGTL
ncbi:MAG: zinc-dependent metalloprotease [Phycisphaerae bacterium]|nr:zinc-dependent metalloprotease [Phycisphaerae bacterium]